MGNNCNKWSKHILRIYSNKYTICNILIDTFIFSGLIAPIIYIACDWILLSQIGKQSRNPIENKLFEDVANIGHEILLRDVFMTIIWTVCATCYLKMIFHKMGDSKRWSCHPQADAGLKPNASLDSPDIDARCKPENDTLK
jgi:hypothetical protein